MLGITELQNDVKITTQYDVVAACGHWSYSNFCKNYMDIPARMRAILAHTLRLCPSNHQESSGSKCMSSSKACELELGPQVSVAVMVTTAPYHLLWAWQPWDVWAIDLDMYVMYSIHYDCPNVGKYHLSEWWVGVQGTMCSHVDSYGSGIMDVTQQNNYQWQMCVQTQCNVHACVDNERLSTLNRLIIRYMIKHTPDI